MRYYYQVHLPIVRKKEELTWYSERCFAGAYLADCKVATPTKIVSDPEAAKKLWEVTKEQIDAARAK